MKGIDLIAEERKRQIDVEGYTDEHDILHGYSELLDAALSYITLKRPVMDVTHDLDSQPSYAVIYDYLSEDGTIHKLRELPPSSWPWGEQYWKPTPSDRIKELVKAGALIAAAIDRLQMKSDKYDGFLGKELKMVDDEIERLEKLKVKEVDLEKEWKEFLKDGDVGFKEIAKHFFELGLKAQKGDL